MNASYTLLYIKAAMLKKEKKSSAPVSRVLCSYISYRNVCHLSSPKVTFGLKHSTLRSSPKAIGRAALNLRFT